MPNRKNYSAPEPPPIATEEPAIIDLVIQDIENFDDLEYTVLIPHLRDRKAFGVAKYGTPLQKSNGRDHRPEGFQELQDFIAYMKQGMERGDEDMRIFFYQAIAMAVDFAQLVEGNTFNYSTKGKNYDRQEEV